MLQKFKSLFFKTDVLYPLILTVLIIVGWHYFVKMAGLPKFLLPPPKAVIIELFQKWHLLLFHSIFTVYELIMGFILSIIVGVPCAIIIVWSKALDKALTPLLLVSQTVPKVAIAPLLVIWFGFGVLPKILISFLIAFFPIVISTAAGLKSVEPDMMDLIKSMSAKKWQVFLKVRIPNSLPYFFSGAKISIALSVIGAIVGEWVGSDKGLGYLLLVANNNMDAVLLFADMVLLSLIGILFFYMIIWLETILLPWHVAMRKESVVETMPTL